ncbi:MAG: TonB-dependent receptor [Bacteroidales bacterium]|nr:TonB-dependent receptor [Bacteroidales bacterium]
MDCKTLNLRYLVARLLLCITFLGLTSVAFAQRTITGKVVDENSQPLIGVTVAVQGTTSGTITDIDGKYTLTIPAGQDNNQIVFSFIGYESVMTKAPESGKLDIQMNPSVTELNEVVAIGYGTKRKGDLTGSIASVSEKDFNGGVVSSPEQLINGKVAGVQIMSKGGSPSSGSSIKIRGGASLNATNNPLIVLDGVPLENGGIKGNDNNFLALINPADIESMSVLKDASSTAIYGSRASNGVIIINTKKGVKDKMKVNFNSTNSVSFKTKTADMLSRDEFIDVINKYGNESNKSLLAENLAKEDNNTDWIEEIFQPAFATDNNLSVSGSIAKVLPTRISVGYLAQDGILKSDNTKRYTANLNLNPSFFHDALKVNVNVKASYNDNTFADQGAIYTATVFDPTYAVKSGDPDAFGGWNEPYTVDDNGKKTPYTNASGNPVALLDYYRSTSTVKRIITNVDVDYTFPFLKDLRAHVTGGFDGGKGEGNVKYPYGMFKDFGTYGRNYDYGPQTQKNTLFTSYLFYSKKNDFMNFDFTAGYDFQKWNSNTPSYWEYSYLGKTEADQIILHLEEDYTHVLLSYYGRANISLLGKYMFTATVRRDGTSRFSKDQRWGTFPSFAVAYRLSEESFMEGLRDVVNNIKLRASWGITGQQEGIGNYNYLSTYNLSSEGAQYRFGDTYYNMYRPAAYVSNLKWETTEAWNFGVDFGFLNDKVTASVDYYTRKTKDLMAKVPVAAGTNFASEITTNVGNVDSKGVEIVLGYSPIQTKDWGLDLNFNATWQDNKISNLRLSENAAISPTLVGETVNSHKYQVFMEGYTPYTFYLKHQLYDADGNPIEGAYADLDESGDDSEGDRYFCHSALPDWIMGFSFNLRYKKFTLSSSLRANIGNYVYNGMSAGTGAFESLGYNNYQNLNISSSVLDTKFNVRQMYSDYYLENASFLKMDNISLSYNFGRITKYFGLNATFGVQNVFTITKYTGVDPEIENGIDNNFYPRPRIFSLSLGFDF